MSQFFASGGQSIRDSALASVLPMTIQDWFPLGLIGLISLQSKGLSRVSSNTTVQKHQFSFLYGPTLMIRLMSLLAEIPERWSLSTSCKRRSLTVCKPGRGISLGMELADTLILDFPASRTEWDKCLLCKASQWYFHGLPSGKEPTCQCR